MHSDDLKLGKPIIEATSQLKIQFLQNPERTRDSGLCQTSEIPEIPSFCIDNLNSIRLGRGTYGVVEKTRYRKSRNHEFRSVFDFLKKKLKFFCKNLCFYVIFQIFWIKLENSLNTLSFQTCCNQVRQRVSQPPLRFDPWGEGDDVSSSTP